MPGTQPFSLLDAAAYPFVAGVAGTLVDVVGIKSIEQSMSIEEVENRGDGRVIASTAELASMDLTVTLGAYTPASVAAIAGGTVTTTGTGATAVTKLVRNVNDVVPYFKLAGQTRARDADGGAARITYPQVSWQGGPDFAFTDNEFAEFAINAKAIPNTAGEIYWYEAMATYTAFV